MCRYSYARKQALKKHMQRHGRSGEPIGTLEPIRGSILAGLQTVPGWD
jgi:hypothetical protein